MIEAIGIDHIVIRVSDLPKAASFYVDRLGCKLERMRPELSMLQLRVGASLIDLVESKEIDNLENGGGNLDHFCLRIADFNVERIIDELRGFCVEAGDIGLRYGARGEAQSIYVRDPDGNKIELRA